MKLFQWHPERVSRSCAVPPARPWIIEVIAWHGSGHSSWMSKEESQILRVKSCDTRAFLMLWMRLSHKTGKLAS
jgi:hypothetical protein